MSDPKITYEEVEEALMDADAIAGPSEAHGTLCGMIAVAGKGAPDNWLPHVLGEYDPQDLLIKDTVNVLLDLHDQVLRDLTEQNYALDILIHEDNYPLDTRVEDLSNWCQGFLYGLSASGLKDIKQLPVDASEILQDMLDISKAGYNPDDGEEENEAAFAEIIEYIRIGAYVIYTTFNTAETSSASPTVH